MTDATTDAPRDELTLKWGTLKGWNLHSDAARAALKAYYDAGTVAAGAMMQNDNPAQVDAICALIDALNADTVYLDWDGKHVSKAEAKAYIREYPRCNVHRGRA